jgi:hypothetical protein
VTDRIERIPFTDRRLGRHIVLDDRSRGFVRPGAVDHSTWRTKSIRIYDPDPNPNQTIGNCTGVAKCVQLNAAKNRVSGRVLNMTDAERVYSLATELDPWPGSWPPTDTGSSGLAAAKAAQKLGLAGEYLWIFGGADGVVQAVMDGDVVNVGTRWDEQMFNPDRNGIVHPGGPVAGGHEWSVRGYDARRDLVLGRCWWGDFRDFWISRSDLNSLLADGGDANVQASI